jgi:hypothetical protein
MMQIARVSTKVKQMPANDGEEYECEDDQRAMCDKKTETAPSSSGWSVFWTARQCAT